MFFSNFLLYVASVLAMSSCFVRTARRANFPDSPLITVSWYVREYVNYLDYRYSEAICDRNNIVVTAGVTSVGAWVK